jgi:uncharacterized protein involved in cysteine biosynthesis
VPAGLGFVLKNRSLWSLALAPAAVAAVLVNLGLVAGSFLVPLVENRLAPAQAELSPVLGLALTLSLWSGMVGAAMALGLAVSLLLTAPLLEKLSRKVEAQLGGRGAGRVPAERWDVAASLRSALVCVAAAVAALALAVVPLVGPILGAAVAAPLLAYQATEGVLGRRELRFADKRAWLLRWRGEACGFGLAALVALLVPALNVLLPPALAVGGARLVVDLEGLEMEEPAGQPASDSPPGSTNPRPM